MQDSWSRRVFLKSGLAAGAGMAFPDPSGNMFNHIKSDPFTLGNDVVLEILSSSHNFSGIGKIKIADKLIRSGRLPMFVEIRNPDAYLFTSYKLKDIKKSDDNIVLYFGMSVIQNGIKEWMQHSVRNRMALNDWTDTPVSLENTTLKLILKPVEHIIENYHFKGFSYQYDYQSSEFQVYKLLDRSTWEIGGSCIGNEFWMRNIFVPPIVKFDEISDEYSTEWYLKNIRNPYVFQFLPFQTEFQGFTFTKNNNGILVTFPNEVKHIRSVFKKIKNTNEIIHWHEHCQNLKYNLLTSPVEVLWLEGKYNEVDTSNIYETFRYYAHNLLHDQAGIKKDKISTYGIVEEWLEPDFEEYTRDVLPRLNNAGVKMVFIPNEFQNAMNTYGVENMCCNVDFKISKVAGSQQLNKFCESAKQNGMKVQMWGNTAISTLTEMLSWRQGYPKRIDFLPLKGSIMETLKKARDPFVRNPSNAIEADNYSPRFAVLNLDDPDVRKYWLDAWVNLLNDTGIESIFLDSSFNLSSDKFHFIANAQSLNKKKSKSTNGDSFEYCPEKEPEKTIVSQYMPHLSLVAEMQKNGYSYYNEDVGVFGLHRHIPPVTFVLNSLSIWRDCLLVFNSKELRKLGLNSAELTFKIMAMGAMCPVQWDHRGRIIRMNHEPFKNTALLKAHNKVINLMDKRFILQDDKGVLYSSDEKKVLWSFKSFKYVLDEEKTVQDIIDDKIIHTDNLLCEAFKIYTIL